MAKKVFNLNISIADFVNTLVNRDKVLNDYAQEEQILNQIFPMYSKFNNIDVLTRITLLNQFYSTAILDIRSIAKHIVNVTDVEQRLRSGDLSVVSEIALIKHGNKTWNHASFASKFANFHNNDAFPILDSLVVKVFCKLRRLGFFKLNTKFSEAELRSNYVKYVEVYKEFISLSGIGSIIYKGSTPNYKLIDNYLWASRKIKGLEGSDPRVLQAPTEYNQIINNAINHVW